MKFSRQSVVHFYLPAGQESQLEEPVSLAKNPASHRGHLSAPALSSVEVPTAQGSHEGDPARAAK